ncbi:MAG: hypothetical protein JWN46_834, partial [Acidimicrobiales bacterium]|nr:hypothetical protein [Acidimicrobiales bacterium]
MRWLGWPDAELVRSRRDGLLYLRADRAFAQVRAEPMAVPVQIVRQVAERGRSAGLQAIVFSWGGFTPKAKDFARQAEIPLFRLSPTGEAHPRSAAATALMRAAEGAALGPRTTPTPTPAPAPAPARSRSEAHAAAGPT